MKTLTIIGAITALLTITNITQARPITITADMSRFSGPPAYIAIYLTDPKGRLKQSLYVGGHKSKYRRSLRGWARGVARSGGRVDGISGASVGSGKRIKFKANIADELIKAGYQIHIDTAVEDHGTHVSDAVTKLDLNKPSVANRGKGYVRELTIQM